jgi:hypothetical protein
MTELLLQLDVKKATIKGAQSQPSPLSVAFQGRQAINHSASACCWYFDAWVRRMHWQGRDEDRQNEQRGAFRTQPGLGL